MNSSQRRKEKKRKHLIRLGRRAEEVANAAEARVRSWQGAATAAAEETERVKDMLNTTERVVEGARAQTDVFEKTIKASHEQSAQFLAEQRRVHLATMADLTEEHAKALARVETQARAAGADAAATIRHLRSELIEPTKLRKRLHRKEAENEQLRLQNNQLRQKLGLPTVEPLVHETDLDLHEELVAGAAT